MIPGGVTVPRAAFVASAVAGLVFLGALWNGFAYDDTVLILGDPGIQDLSTFWERMTQPSWPGSFGAQVGGWRPVTTALWSIAWAAGGGGAWVFHLFAVLAHATATALVVLMLGRLTNTLAALMGGLVFAVHPVHVEAVANVAGSAEPFAAVFALSAAWLHCGARDRYPAWRAVAVVVLFTLGTLAKEGAAVLPLLLVLLDAYDRRLDGSGVIAWLRERWFVYAGLTMTLFAVLFARAAVVGGVTTASTPPGGAVLTEIPRVWTVLSTWPHYLRLLVFPFDLSVDYGPGVIPIAYGWSIQAVTGLIVGITMFSVAFVLWRTGEHRAATGARLIALGILWAATALLPVANILYLGPVLVAERTFYMASVGAAIAAACVFDALRERGARTAWLFAGVIVLSGAGRTASRVPVWNDTDAVMTQLLDDHPESGRAWFAFGQRLMKRGQHAEALTAFKLSIGLLNSEYKESTEVASHLMAMGRPEAARLFLTRAWREKPEWPTAPGLLAAIELNAGEYRSAEAAARAAASVQPDNGNLHHLWAEALSRQGRHAEAVDHRRDAIVAGLGVRIRPWFLLVADYTALTDTSAALSALDSAALRVQSPEDEEILAQLRAALAPPRPTNVREPS